MQFAFEKYVLDPESSKSAAEKTSISPAPLCRYMASPSHGFTMPVQSLSCLHRHLALAEVFALVRFKTHAPSPRPISPSWSPVKQFGGYQQGKRAAQRVQVDVGLPGVLDRVSGLLCGCSKSCLVHGHEHAHAWAAPVPASHLRSFWGALGCSCFI